MDSMVAVCSNLKRKGPAGSSITPNYTSHSLPLWPIRAVAEHNGNDFKPAKIAEAGEDEGGIPSAHRR
jgi:hypothetical protein